MDPLSALSLAGTVVQFVDFGCKLLSEGRQLYQSSTGKLTTNEEIETITQDLQTLIRKLRDSFEDQGVGGGEEVEAGGSLELICERAAVVAEEIIQKLQKLVLPPEELNRNKVRRGVKTFQQLLKVVWNSHDIDDLVGRLGELRKAIDSNVLFQIKDKLDSQSVILSDRFDQVDLQGQRILRSLLESQETSNRQIIVAVAQMMSRLESVNQESHRQTQNYLVGPYDIKATADITAGIGMLAVSSSEETELRNDVQDTIIESLHYPTMTNRYDDIVEAFPETLEWAFHDPEDKDLPRTNLGEWLKTGESIYWISGKPGSGKSTLMKHLFDDRRTRQYLRTWATTIQPRDAPLSIATFFFWNSGTTEQKSQTGLLRSLLHQILLENPQLVPIILPALWAETYSQFLDRQKRKSKNLAFHTSWGLRELKNAIKLLAVQTQIPLKLFILVDGLDEFEGDHEDLMSMFREMTHLGQSRLKTCLSSRPWVVFEDNLRNYASLKMQNLTYKDIEIYVNERLRSNSAFKGLAEQQPEDAEELIQEVVQKADGVFLWVRIVVKSLLSGIRNLDEMSDLRRRLLLLPKELIPLYKHLMIHIDPIHLEWVSKVFRILQAARGWQLNLREDSPLPVRSHGTLTLIVLYLAITPGIKLSDTRKMSPISITTKCRTLAVQLTARCAGFLETSTYEGDVNEGPTSGVIFLHRTARDFIEDKDRWAEILSSTSDTPFRPFYSLALGSSLCVVLEWHLYGEGHKYRITSDMCAVASDALIYANRVDLKNQGELPKVFEEMGKAISWNESGRHAWSQSLGALQSQSEIPVLSFLELTAIYGFVPYLVRRIPKLTQERLDALLHVIFYHGCPISSSKEIVFALLSHGAVPSRALKKLEAYREFKRADIPEQRCFEAYMCESDDVIPKKRRFEAYLWESDDVKSDGDSESGSEGQEPEVEDHHELDAEQMHMGDDTKRPIKRRRTR